MLVKNRIVMPAMGTGFATPEGLITQQSLDYYEARAKGGYGMVIVETASVDFPRGIYASNRLVVDNDAAGKKLEEELITLGDTLQQEILTIKKEMKDDKSNPELQKLYQENSLLRQQLQRQQLSSNQTIQQLQQQYQQLRQMKEQQRAEQDIVEDKEQRVENKEQQQRVENKEQQQRVDRTQHVDYVTDDLIEIFSIPMPAKKTNTTNAVIEVIETDSEEVDLDDELREELQELNQQ
jgi:hypothetical protein